MARKLLAVLLIFSWATLSAFDVLEDLQVLVSSEIDSAGPINNSLPNTARADQAANNILEWANPIERPYNPLFELLSFGELQLLLRETPKYAAKVHKLHHIFLI
ncbi:MAG: hypothetical protein ACREQW_06730 [Candidatus Binatia bacterium]